MLYPASTEELAPPKNDASNAMMAKDLRDNPADNYRRCLVTGETLPRDKLIRFVVNAEQQVVPDIAAKLPGRGMWVTAARAAVNKAAQSKLFGKSAKKHVTIGTDDLAEHVTVLLRKRIIELLGIAKSAGIIIPGLPQLRECLAIKDGKHPPIEVIFCSHDIGRDASERLANVAVAVKKLPFATQELGVAIGKAGVSVMGLRPHALSSLLKIEVTRWHDMQNNDSEASVNGIITA